MYTIFNREPFTLWKIAIVDRCNDKTIEEVEADDPNCSDYMEFCCTYRTTFCNGKESEQFTIMSNEIDYVFMQLNIFKNGDMKYYSKIPVSLDINKKNKRINILPLVYCKMDNEKKIIDFIDISE